MVLDRSRPYRGGDRRSGAASAPLGAPFALAGALVLALVTAFGILASGHPVISAGRTAGLSELFETLSGSFAVGAFLLCLLRWRLSGEGTALWVGTATLVFGIVVIGVAEIGLPLVADPHELRAVIPATYGAGLLGTFALAVVAWSAPTIDSRLRPWRLAVAALALVGLGAVVLDYIGPLQRALVAVHPVVGRPGFRAAARTALSVPLAAVGLGFVIHGVLRRRTLLAWSGLALSTLAIGELSAALQQSRSDVWLPGGHLLRAVGFFLLIVGASRDLQRTYADQRGRLFDSVVSMRTLETRQRASRAGARRRDHDLRGSLMAIEGAALTLQRHNDALSADAREKLASMLAAEIDRLKNLVVEPPAPTGPFTLADAVQRAVADAAADGSEVEVDVKSSAAVVGSPADTTEAVRELVAAAAAEAGPGAGPLALELADDGQWALVRLRFRSAAFPRHERRAILARRAAGTGDMAEEGMGLHVAGQLAREQGGDLALHAEDDGGLCFELRLPLDPES